MTIEGVLFWFIIGGIVGWFVGDAVMGSDFGVAGEIAIGGAGGVLGGWFLPIVGIEIGPGVIPDVINAAVGGAIVLPIVVTIKSKYLDIE